MAQNSVRATLILRNDLAATWASRDPILARGEIGAEIDTGLLKIGDGSTSFNNLKYINLPTDGDGALVTMVNNKFTVADYGKSYWRYNAVQNKDEQVFESDLSKWPATLQLEIKNHVARWVQPKDNFNINYTQGKIDGALITLARDPIDSTEAATKDYVDNTIAGAIANAPHLKRRVVAQLPAIEYADENTIYMIKDNSVTGADKYREYLMINNELIQIGDTSVDLTGYAEKPTNYTEGHLLAIGPNGTLIDANFSAADLTQLSVATTTNLGGVLSSNLDNQISVDANGLMEINSVATDKLYVPDGSEFILNGGGA